MPSLARVSCLLLELWYIKVKCIRIKCLVRLINACRLFCRPTDIGRILVHARVGRIESHFIKRILFMRRIAPSSYATRHGRAGRHMDIGS